MWWKCCLKCSANPWAPISKIKDSGSLLACLSSLLRRKKAADCKGWLRMLPNPPRARTPAKLECCDWEGQLPPFVRNAYFPGCRPKCNLAKTDVFSQGNHCIVDIEHKSMPHKPGCRNLRGMHSPFRQAAAGISALAEPVRLATGTTQQKKLTSGLPIDLSEFQLHP